MSGHPGALRLVSGRISRGVKPPEPMPPSRWLAENLVLVDGESSGELWSPEGAPYLPEIADCLSDDHPCNFVTVRKSQQTGASILALGWCLYIAEREPANTLYAVPGLETLRDISGQKLQPLIDAWQRRMKRTVIYPVTARAGTGSTTYEKRFPGGYLSLANANAVMDLSMKTVKKGVRDELSKWQDIPGVGDPENLFFGRFTAFRRTKSFKILDISTPEIDTGDETGETAGHCRIDRAFKRSDQRFWRVRCPECNRAFVHDIALFRVDREHPHKSYYQCPSCTHQISEPERVIAVREGYWHPQMPGLGREPGFHIDAFISLMMSYEAIAEDVIKAKTEKDQKDLHNLVLGLPYKFRGDAPDHVRLMERREDFPRRRIPAHALLITVMADVQHSGIYFEVVAWGPDKRSWTIDVGFLDGDTTDDRRGAWVSLAEIYERSYEDAFGNRRRADAFGVDAGDGGRANQVYAWCAKRGSAYALKGEDGWERPAISAQPKLVDIDLEGRVTKNGAKLWKTGTWSLKLDFYDYLRKSRVSEDGLTINPPGYCHFALWLDEIYFKQITSEFLEDVINRGRVTGRRWTKRGENHYLDCRIGNMAMAEHLGLSAMSPEEWRELARRRQVPDGTLTPDLFAPEPHQVMAAGIGRSEPERPFEAPEPEPQPDSWLGGFNIDF
ncbi:terminase gpA endonuclease subunit [Xanthobacter sp. VTT E-85241]|uniref:terminase gpA endonuclease subunit n=1 Tax=Roseixanthobacter finlandensis TaxID=3119922 RepID=UPI0037296664